MKRIIIIVILFVSIALVGFNIDGIMGVPFKYIKEHVQVTATVYKTNYGHTGKTADGTKIRKQDAKQLKIIAVSPDMLKKWPLGTHVIVIGADSLNGVYVVRDVMNRRYKHRIDILVNKNSPICMYKKAQLIKVDEDFFLN